MASILNNEETQAELAVAQAVAALPQGKFREALEDNLKVQAQRRKIQNLVPQLNEGANNSVALALFLVEKTDESFQNAFGFSLQSKVKELAEKFSNVVTTKAEVNTSAPNPNVSRRSQDILADLERAGLRVRR